MSIQPTPPPATYAEMREFSKALSSNFQQSYVALEELIHDPIAAATPEEYAAHCRLREFGERQQDILRRAIPVLATMINEDDGPGFDAAYAEFESLFAEMISNAVLCCDKAEKAAFGADFVNEINFVELRDLDDYAINFGIIAARMMRLDAHFSGSTMEEVLSDMLRPTGLSLQEIEDFINEKGAAEAFLQMFAGAMIQAYRQKQLDDLNHNATIIELPRR